MTVPEKLSRSRYKRPSSPATVPERELPGENVAAAHEAMITMAVTSGVGGHFAHATSTLTIERAVNAATRIRIGRSNEC
jgi:hypothetical protein